MQQHSKKDPSNQELCFKQHPKESLDPPKGQGLTLFFRRVLAFAHLSEKMAEPVRETTKDDIWWGWGAKLKPSGWVEEVELWSEDH